MHAHKHFIKFKLSTFVYNIVLKKISICQHKEHLIIDDTETKDIVGDKMIYYYVRLPQVFNKI